MKKLLSILLLATAFVVNAQQGSTGSFAAVKLTTKPDKQNGNNHLVAWDSISKKLVYVFKPNVFGLQGVLNNGSTGQVETPTFINVGQDVDVIGVPHFNGNSLTFNETQGQGMYFQSIHDTGDVLTYGNHSTTANDETATANTIAYFQGQNLELEDVIHTGTASAEVDKDTGANASLYAETINGEDTDFAQVTVKSFGSTGVSIYSNRDVTITRNDGTLNESIEFNPERIRLFTEDVNGYGGLINIDDDGLSLRALVATGRTTIAFSPPVAENTLRFPSPIDEDIYNIALSVEGFLANNQGQISLPTFMRVSEDSPTASIVKYWIGTQAEYEAEPGYDSATLYFITDAPNPYYERDATIVTTKTASELNSLKPSAPVGFILDCPAIPSTPTRYVKSTASGNWIPSALQTELTP